MRSPIGMYIMTQPISMVYFINPSHRSVSPPIVARQQLGKNPPIVARQWLSKNISAATNTQAIIRLLYTSFSMWSVSSQNFLFSFGLPLPSSYTSSLLSFTYLSPIKFIIFYYLIYVTLYIFSFYCYHLSFYSHLPSFTHLLSFRLHFCTPICAPGITITS
jgi:hypothetical protein